MQVNSDNSAVIARLEQLERRAAERICDLLMGDDCQAWKEAENHLRLHHPDLYAKLDGWEEH